MKANIDYLADVSEYDGMSRNHLVRTIHCPECGKVCPVESDYCEECGNYLDVTTIEEEIKSNSLRVDEYYEDEDGCIRLDSELAEDDELSDESYFYSEEKEFDEDDEEEEEEYEE